MPTKAKTTEKTGVKCAKSFDPRQRRKTFGITQRGIKTDKDLADFFEAALSDIDAGRTDVNEMKRMTTVTGQIIALQNLRLKAKLFAKRDVKRNFFLEEPRKQ